MNEGLHDKGLTDGKERQQEDHRPEIAVQVIACYQPHVGRCDCVMDQTEVGLSVHQSDSGPQAPPMVSPGQPPWSCTPLCQRVRTFKSGPDVTEAPQM